MIRKRTLLLGSAAALAFIATRGMRRPAPAQAAAQPYEVTHTDAEWRKLLTPAQYNILRQQGTELPFTSPLLNEHRAGTFNCAGCALPLYASKTKFDSGTGWPSFWAPLPNAVLTSDDASFGMDRTEVHCRRCGSHLGHVFPDGPPPTGQRYCMDGLALTFTPA
jgi:peptide-methionine (R)-S-oxide reductase